MPLMISDLEDEILGELCYTVDSISIDYSDVDEALEDVKAVI